MHPTAKIALERIVYAMFEKKQPVTRSFLSGVWMHIDPQPDYGTRTKMGKDLTTFMKREAQLYQGRYVKDANGRNARIEF